MERRQLGKTGLKVSAEGEMLIGKTRLIGYGEAARYAVERGPSVIAGPDRTGRR